MKKSYKLPIVLALAALIILATSALAVGYFTGLVDWSGKPIDETAELPASTIAPTAAETAERYEVSAPEGEIWVIRYSDGSGEISFADVEVSESELLALIADTPLKPPAPLDGFVIAEAHISYSFTAADIEKFELIETDSPVNGATRERYKAEGGFISGYNITFANADGGEISLSAQLDREADEHGFGAGEQDSYSPVELGGFDKALLRENPEILALYALDTGISAMEYVPVHALFGLEYREIATYDCALYKASTRTLSVEELFALLENIS